MQGGNGSYVVGATVGPWTPTDSRSSTAFCDTDVSGCVGTGSSGASLSGDAAHGGGCGGNPIDICTPNAYGGCDSTCRCMSGCHGGVDNPDRVYVTREYAIGNNCREINSSRERACGSASICFDTYSSRAAVPIHKGHPRIDGLGGGAVAARQRRAKNRRAQLLRG